MSTLFFSALQRHGKNTAEIKRCLGGGKSGKQVRDYYYRLAKKAREDLVKTRGPENITDELVHHEMHRAWREKCLAGQALERTGKRKSTGDGQTSCEGRGGKISRHHQTGIPMSDGQGNGAVIGPGMWGSGAVGGQVAQGWRNIRACQPPPEQGKLTIRCYPISEELQDVIKSRGINPLHELTLPSRKCLRKLARHLEGKFSSAWPECAVQLHYFGSLAAIDMDMSGWDLYSSEGEPRIFRVRYSRLVKPIPTSPVLASGSHRKPHLNPAEAVYNVQSPIAGVVANKHEELAMEREAAADAGAHFQAEVSCPPLVDLDISCPPLPGSSNPGATDSMFKIDADLSSAKPDGDGAAAEKPESQSFFQRVMSGSCKGGPAGDDGKGAPAKDTLKGPEPAPLPSSDKPEPPGLVSSSIPRSLDRFTLLDTLQGFSHGFTRAIAMEHQAATQRMQANGDGGVAASPAVGGRFLDQQMPTSIEMLHSGLLPPTSLGPSPWTTEASQPVSPHNVEPSGGKTPDQRAFAALFDSVSPKVSPGLLPPGSLEQTAPAARAPPHEEPPARSKTLSEAPPVAAGHVPDVPSPLRNIAQHLAPKSAMPSAKVPSGFLGPATEDSQLRLLAQSNSKDGSQEYKAMWHLSTCSQDLGLSNLVSKLTN